MHPRLFLSLYKVIEDWSNDECNSEEWQYEDFLFPKEIDKLMTDAAVNVFDAIVLTSRHMATNSS